MRPKIKMAVELHPRDPYLVAPFVSKGDQWFSFDDPEAIRIKSEYILSEGYAGGMFWSIETDDFQARQFLLTLDYCWVADALVHAVFSR